MAENTRNSLPNRDEAILAGIRPAGCKKAIPFLARFIPVAEISVTHADPLERETLRNHG